MSSPIRTILDDLYVSTHNGKTPSDIGDDGIDQKDLDQAEAALNTYVEEREEKARQDYEDFIDKIVGSEMRIYEQLELFKGDSITDFLYNHAPEPFYSRRVGRIKEAKHE